MTVLSAAMNGHSTAGLVGQPAYRRFLSDMTDERGVIPKAMLRHPELAALEEQRQRLVAALDDARRPSGPPQMTDEQYIAARTKALRDGGEMPAPPPPQAATDEYTRRRARDVEAAGRALLALADDICAALRDHPEWEREQRNDIAALRAEAEQKRREAEQAERKAESGKVLALWLERAAQEGESHGVV